MNKKIVIGITGLAVIALNSVVFYAASAANTPKSAATSSAIKAAKWNPTVKLTYSKSSVLMQPTGIPNHARDAYYAVPNAGVVVPDATTANIIRDPTKAQTYNFTIPTTPKYSSKVTNTSLGCCSNIWWHSCSKGRLQDVFSNAKFLGCCCSIRHRHSPAHRRHCLYLTCIYFTMETCN